MQLKLFCDDDDDDDDGGVERFRIDLGTGDDVYFSAVSDHALPMTKQGIN